ncbi:MAG: anaerobic ribonucleoside-triphosphate reductase activating protein [Clostridia bacterium]|nr:anaerobic ribonucleoside-triphosphate reductase activating protein [Clostridia bacterium]
MNVQGFQKLTLLDFPGKVACTVFTGGCNLRCPFCHNASLVKYPGAQENMEEEVLSYLEKRKGILEGVCITGGEPLLQPELPAFIQRVKEMGYAVKLDTNGSDPEALRRLLQTVSVDYIAMDVKNAPSSYEAAIGLEKRFAPFEESLGVIRQSGVPYELRTTFVKGIHRECDVVELGQYLAGEKRYFLQNFVESGDILKEGYLPFEREEMANFLAIIRKTIPDAQLRGQEE